ncbi:hypothetical protein N7478_007424 [Penicillium angulare]|uniref:uncharacterized protein n=1 Tax=Penicillium angulare TaxID=116970 RepID=UPI0025403114|nr:uncharacterized protein N7478_007424 [Penicillium angulare]KAJ5272299.1 hypothetical protein N7478_007424 [Penicillium angulare]
MMVVTFRVVVAITLVFALFLVKNHLSSIDDQWQSQSGRSAGRSAQITWRDAGARIELVSGDDHISSSPIPSVHATPTPSSTPTGSSYEEPTGKPVAVPRFEPQQIPVEVPGEVEDDYDFWLDDYLDELDNDLGRYGHNQMPDPRPPPPQVPKLEDRIIVLGRMSWEDSDWLDYELPEWPSAVYVVDDPDAELTVEENKGKESNIYLQYIRDNYDDLPEYMVFLHAHRTSSHVEFDEQDNVLTVQRLQLDYVKQMGYANLRCDWGPGCPDEVYPFRQMAERTTEIAFAGAWIGIFNNTDIPEVVGTPCCAQFAVTREQVHARPLSDYEHYHTWLMETELDDETSGRVFEYLWHIIFGQDPVSCPAKAQCYWDVYGMEYVEPPVPDWISDNPFLSMGNYDDEFGELDFDDENQDEIENEDEEDPFDLDGPLDDLDLDDSPSESMVVNVSEPDLRQNQYGSP